MKPIAPIFIATLFTLTSCVSSKLSKSTKQISRSAAQIVLNDPALQTAHVGISIYEPASGKYWYNYQGDKYFVPASNTKLPTCYAAMKYLGDSLPGLRYHETADAVYVQSTGDPTFLLKEYSRQPVYEFLKKSKPIYWSNSNWKENYLGSGWSWNDYLETYMANRSYQPVYGNLVTFTGKGEGFFTSSPFYFERKIAAWSPNAYGGNIDVSRPVDQNNFFIGEGRVKSQSLTFYPDDETVLGLLTDTIKQDIFIGKNDVAYTNLIHSQPTDSLLQPMMHRSDNFFAEQSLLMVSNEVLGYMNDAQIIDTLLKTDLKNLPQKPRWVDGSGLSRYNLFTPQDFVFILDKMKNEFGMDRVKNILATGNTGTLNNYYVAENGYIFAKTGTLSGVVALSGFLYTKNKHLFIFSVLVNNHNTSATAVRRAVEKFIEGLRNEY